MTQRVIKFRAWDKRHRCYLRVGGKYLIDIWHLFSDDGTPIKGYEIQQFTGLHDKNGVEIYEGDVVEVAGVGNAIVKICPSYGVCFNNGDYEYPYIDCAAEGDYPTVIGNIYENPELLEENYEH